MLRDRGEPRVAEACLLPFSIVAASSRVVEIYRKFVGYRGLACRREKGEIGCSKEEIGVIVAHVFQTRSHAGVTRARARALVGRRSDPPTHSSQSAFGGGR